MHRGGVALTPTAALCRRDREVRTRLATWCLAIPAACSLLLAPWCLFLVACCLLPAACCSLLAARWALPLAPLPKVTSPCSLLRAPYSVPMLARLSIAMYVLSVQTSKQTQRNPPSITLSILLVSPQSTHNPAVACHFLGLFLRDCVRWHGITERCREAEACTGDSQIGCK